MQARLLTFHAFTCRQLAQTPRKILDILTMYTKSANIFATTGAQVGVCIPFCYVPPSNNFGRIARLGQLGVDVVIFRRNCVSVRLESVHAHQVRRAYQDGERLAEVSLTPRQYGHQPPHLPDHNMYNEHISYSLHPWSPINT